jgi:ketosteroid isomerase-like protein
MLTRELAESVIAKYKDAWERQDPDAILEIFTSDAIYHERVLKEPFRGRNEIRQYWKTKVVEGQANIEFNLLCLYIDGDTMIAEWDVVFDDRAQNLKKHMREVAIAQMHEGKIQSLREYWSSEVLPIT